MGYLLCCVFVIILISETANVNISGLIMSLSDVHELLDAYNRRDYVETGIKLIDLKLKIDPPEKGSTTEKRLLQLRNLLENLHPYYIRAREILKSFKQNVDGIRTNMEETQTKVIEDIIKFLDKLEFNINVVIENLKNQLRRLLRENNQNKGTTVRKQTRTPPPITKRTTEEKATKISSSNSFQIQRATRKPQNKTSTSKSLKDVKKGSNAKRGTKNQKKC